MQELCTAPNYPLWATKFTMQPLDLSTLVVQEHHLWLNLAKTWDGEKVRFLDAPIVHCRVDLPLDFLRVTLSTCISTKRTWRKEGYTSNQDVFKWAILWKSCLLLDIFCCTTSLLLCHTQYNPCSLTAKQAEAIIKYTQIKCNQMWF